MHLTMMFREALHVKRNINVLLITLTIVFCIKVCSLFLSSTPLLFWPNLVDIIFTTAILICRTLFVFTGTCLSEITSLLRLSADCILVCIHAVRHIATYPWMRNINGNTQSDKTEGTLAVCIACHNLLRS